MMLNREPCPDGTDRIRLLKYVPILDLKTKMELLKLKIGFTLPYNGELSTLDEHFDWLHEEYIVSFVGDEGIAWEVLDQLVIDLKSREGSLDKFDKEDFIPIKYYVATQASLVCTLDAIKTEMIDDARTKILEIITTKDMMRMEEYVTIFNEFTTAISNKILDDHDLRECLVARVGLANRVRRILARRRERRPLRERRRAEPEPEPTPEPTPEPPKKEKEAKPSKQSQTRSANKAKNQAKKEREEFERRAIEAEKAKIEAEKRKQALKKAKKEASKKKE